jgi:hypothetical protein
MRKSPASSTFPADRKSSRNPTPSFASSIAGTFPSSSNTRGSNSRASAPPCSATQRQFFIMRQNDRADLEDMAQGHRAARSDQARDHELSAARPSIGSEVFAVHLFSHRLRPESLRHGPQHLVARNALLQFVQRRTFRQTRPRTSPKPNIVEGIIAHANSPEINQNQNAYEKIFIQFIPLACVVCLFTGCAAVTRTATDVAWARAARLSAAN